MERDWQCSHPLLAESGFAVNCLQTMEAEMADLIEVKTTSAEDVAHKLYQDVLAAEGHPYQHMQPADARTYLLDTFAECLTAARGFRRK